jgi:uncharacterized oxidoreductase
MPRRAKAKAPIRRIGAEPLTTMIARLLEHAGAGPRRALVCARHLVGANLAGHDSHGVGMAPAYLRWIAEGWMVPEAHLIITSDRPAVLVVDGAYGLGPAVAAEAMALVIDRARTFGVACLALKNTCHIGRIGAYGEQCADAGLVSMHFVNVVGPDPAVAPFGGRQPRMLTNPYCCAVPRPDGDHVVLDFATSAVAIGKLAMALKTGTPAPEGVLVDAEGEPTTDPAAFFTSGARGHLLPFGLHKGGGLQIIVELLGGALAGHLTMQPASPRRGLATLNNMMSVIIDPDAFGDCQAYEAEAEAMLAYIRSTPPLAGHAAVLAPGDPERITRAERSANGIPIDARTWSDITKAAAALGIHDLPE